MQVADDSPILIVPYMWIGDFVRCHSVVEAAADALSQQARRRAGDHALRAACRLHAGRAAGHRCRPAPRPPGFGDSTAARRAAQARGLRQRRWSCRGTWKSALAPFLAGIPERTGFVGEAASSCSTICAAASASCRGWSTDARRWRCRAAPSSRPSGRNRN